MLKKTFSVPFFQVSMLIITNIFVFVYAANAQRSWDQTRSEDGVKVYERESSHRLNDIKTVFNIDGEINSAIAFLLDEDAFKKMVGNIKEARLVEQVSNSVLYYYLSISVENIINRDAVVKVSFARDSRSGTVTCTMKLDNSINYKTENKSVMPFTAHWYLKPKRSGKVKVTLVYSGEIDEYNDFVYTLVEELMQSQLHKVSKRMKSEVNSFKYQNAKPNVFR